MIRIARGIDAAPTARISDADRARQARDEVAAQALRLGPPRTETTGVGAITIAADATPVAVVERGRRIVLHRWPTVRSDRLFAIDAADPAAPLCGAALRTTARVRARTPRIDVRSRIDLRVRCATVHRLDAHGCVATPSSAAVLIGQAADTLAASHVAYLPGALAVRITALRHAPARATHFGVSPTVDVIDAVDAAPRRCVTHLSGALSARRAGRGHYTASLVTREAVDETIDVIEALDATHQLYIADEADGGTFAR